MQVERIDNEIVIRISSDVNSERLNELLEQMRYEELTSKSTATQEQVDKIASDINSNWWMNNKSKFLK